MAKIKSKQTWRHGLPPAISAATPPGMLPVVGPPHPHKGPAPGTVDRYSASDRKLYPELEQLVEKCGSITAAAHELARQRKVAGTGTEASRARRLATRYLRDHSQLG
jgi:hypothetical protein